MRDREEAEVAAELAALSTGEIVAALGAAGGLSPFSRRFVERLARMPSARLGRSLARFDALIGDVGIAAAAKATLDAFGVRLEVDGAVPLRGGLLVVTNHPGAYDALALLAALRRKDVALVAADRTFLKAMPTLAAHLVFVDDTCAFGRLAGLRRAVAWLGRGGALVQFGAGTIEPDARFTPRGAEVLGPWSEGTAVLAAAAAGCGATVIPAFVSGVHSPRTKRLPPVRWAERRGITTLAPLLQATLPGFADVVTSVRLGAPLAPPPSDSKMNARYTCSVRDAVAALRPRCSAACGSNLRERNGFPDGPASSGDGSDPSR